MFWKEKKWEPTITFTEPKCKKSKWKSGKPVANQNEQKQKLLNQKSYCCHIQKSTGRKNSWIHLNSLYMLTVRGMDLLSEDDHGMDKYIKMISCNCWCTCLYKSRRSIGNCLEGLSVLLLSLSASCLILSAVGVTGAAAFVGIGALTTLIAAVGGLMLGIGALATYYPGMEEFLDKGLSILER